MTMKWRVALFELFGGAELPFSVVTHRKNASETLSDLRSHFDPGEHPEKLLRDWFLRFLLKPFRFQSSGELSNLACRVPK
jgi:hypothetical protein